MMRIALIYGDNTQVGNYFMSLRAYEPNFATQFDHEVFVEKAAGVSHGDALAAIQHRDPRLPGRQGARPRAVRRRADDRRQPDCWHSSTSCSLWRSSSR